MDKKLGDLIKDGKVILAIQTLKTGRDKAIVLKETPIDGLENGNSVLDDIVFGTEGLIASGVPYDWRNHGIAKTTRIVNTDELLHQNLIDVKRPNVRETRPGEVASDTERVSLTGVPKLEDEVTYLTGLDTSFFPSLKRALNVPIEQVYLVAKKQ